MRFTDLHRNSQFALLAFAAFLCFVVYFGFMVSAAQASESIFDPVWELKNPPAKQPYAYIVVRDVDRVCRQAGAKPMYEGRRLVGCALVRAEECFIYLPEGASRWLLADVVKHEDKHCAGWVHD